MARPHNQLAKTILLALLAAGLTTSPRKSQQIWVEILRLLFPSEKNFPKATTEAQVRKQFHRLRNAELISFKELSDGEIKIELTSRGRKRALQYKLETLKIKKPRTWDRKWRIIVFDIPEREKKARDSFRQSLRAMGCLQIQKSVWIHPFPCEDEIEFVAQLFGVGQYFFLATAKINHDKTLRDWFNLT